MVTLLQATRLQKKKSEHLHLWLCATKISTFSQTMMFSKPSPSVFLRSDLTRASAERQHSAVSRGQQNILVLSFNTKKCFELICGFAEAFLDNICPESLTEEEVVALGYSLSVI